MTTRHFAGATGYLTTDQSLPAVAQALGIDAPKRVDPLAPLDQEQTADQVLGRAASQMADGTAETQGDWLARQLADLQRAQAVDALRTGLASRGTQISAARHSHDMAQHLAVYAAAARKVATALERAAVKLPDDALDPAAVLAADASREWKAAQQCLAQLGAFANLVNPLTASPNQTRHVLSVVDVPTVAVEVRAAGTVAPGAVTNPDRNRGAVRAFMADVFADADLALIDVARGRYGDVKLSPVTTLAQISERAARVRDAQDSRVLSATL